MGRVVLGWVEFPPSPYGHSLQREKCGHSLQREINFKIYFGRK